jgi:hypothetical protein
MTWEGAEKFNAEIIQKWNKRFKADPIAAVSVYFDFLHESELSGENEAWEPIVAIGVKFELDPFNDKGIFELDPEAVFLKFVPKKYQADIDRAALAQVIQFTREASRARTFLSDHRTCDPT